MLRQPAFWAPADTASARPVQRGLGALLALGLSPLGLAVGALAARRMARASGYRARLPVVCIGNLVAGGQGKTPLALAVAEGLLARGRDVIFLTRGYGGREGGPLLVAPHHRSADVGDEALLLAAAARCIVSGDRAAGARLAETLAGPSAHPVIVMDDGFQNPALFKTLSLIAGDAGFGTGNGRVLPAGPLRAPLQRQLEQADAIVMIGEGAPGAALGAAARTAGLPVLQAHLRPVDPVVPPDTPVVAYAGIGRPEKFFATLRALGTDVREAVASPDHHPFTPGDAARLLALARKHDGRLLTTMKDKMRLDGAVHGNPQLAALDAASIGVPVRLVITAGQDMLDAAFSRAGV